MARSPSKFRKQDVTRLLKAVADAGECVRSVRVDDNGITVVTGEVSSVGRAVQSSANEWDDVQ